MKNRNKTNKQYFIQLSVAAIIFIILGFFIIKNTPTIEISWICSILLLTIFLFVFEVLPIDVTAICIMVLLGLSSLLFPYMGLQEPLVPQTDLFNGFKSNAVISIIAVMIIGAGLDMTGVMGVVAKYIMKLGGTSESRIIAVISSAVGIISSFMQNVGAAALFLPVIGRISSRSGISISRLLMPMGFCAILGGTMTLVGSSPLILLNDLITDLNINLPADKQMQGFGLFSVTPIGIVMILIGVAYFIFLGKFVLPKSKSVSANASMALSYYKEAYGLNYDIIEVTIPKNSNLVNKLLGDFETEYNVRVVASMVNGIIAIGDGYLPLNHRVKELESLAIVGDKKELEVFIKEFNLSKAETIQKFADVINPSQAGLAEAVIHPASPLVDSCARDFKLRSQYGVSVLAIIRGTKVLSVGQDVRSMLFSAGDTLVMFSNWKNFSEFDKEKDMVVVTSNYPHEIVRPHKVGVAITSLIIALSLVLLTNLPLSVSLLVGALGMILSKVLSIEEAYSAVSWKTVFLLASLIPLGAAVDQSGTAKWIAEITLSLLDGVPIWGLQLAIATLATFFTLVMSNVGATVLLVPLAVNIAIGTGANPAIFALTVGLATSNSFLIPTHQVNALIMGPGRYGVKDFVKAGGIMTILFLIVLMIMLNLIY